MTCRHQCTNPGRPNRHGSENQTLETSPLGSRNPAKGVKFTSTGHAGIAFSYTNYSKTQDLLPAVPLWQGVRLVLPQQQEQLRPGIFGLQFEQGVHRVGRSRPLGFARVHDHVWPRCERQPRHRQTMLRRAQGPGLVPGLSSRKDLQFIQTELIHSSLRQRHMRVMRRVKGAAEDADALRCLRQTQSLRGRKSVYRRDSGDPASSWRRYDQFASGGMDSKIDSVRPPDCKPKCVPRSHTRLNST